MSVFGLDGARLDWMSAGCAPAKLNERVADLYRQHRDEVYRYLVTMGISPGEAQEFTQEAFLRLFEVLAAGQDIRQHRAWVYAVARNLALNRRERAARESETGLEPTAATRDPEQALIEREAVRQVNDAVERLSPQQRQCLFLRAQGFRYREIAEITGASASSVGEHLRRALQRLRKAIE